MTAFNLARADNEILEKKKWRQNNTEPDKIQSDLPKYGRCEWYLNHLTKHVESYSGNDNGNNINVTGTGLYGLEEDAHKYRDQRRVPWDKTVNTTPHKGCHYYTTHPDQTKKADHESRTHRKASP